MVLATGAVPRRLPIGGAHLDGVLVFRDIRDAEILTQHLSTVGSLVVVGGGFIGLEVAANAAAAGVRTAVVEAVPALMNRVVSADTANCANLPNPSPIPGHAPRLRLESVDNAVEQAKAAATTLVGPPQPYRGVPWFWSDQGNLKLQIAGLACARDDVAVRTGNRIGQHTVLRYRNSHLVAAECVNSPADFLARVSKMGAAVMPSEDRVGVSLIK